MFYFGSIRGNIADRILCFDIEALNLNKRPLGYVRNRGVELMNVLFLFN